MYQPQFSSLLHRSSILSRRSVSRFSILSWFPIQSKPNILSQAAAPGATNSAFRYSPYYFLLTTASFIRSSSNSLRFPGKLRHFNSLSDCLLFQRTPPFSEAKDCIQPIHPRSALLEAVAACEALLREQQGKERNALLKSIGLNIELLIIHVKSEDTRHLIQCAIQLRERFLRTGQEDGSDPFDYLLTLRSIVPAVREVQELLECFSMKLDDGARGALMQSSTGLTVEKMNAEYKFLMELQEHTIEKMKSELGSLLKLLREPSKILRFSI